MRRTNQLIYVLYAGVLLLGILPLRSQRKQNFHIRTVAFYNVENLFDVMDDPQTFDDDKTPEGKGRWTVDRYLQKIENISKVISAIGSNERQGPPDLIGLCEIENVQVLKDLIHHPNLKKAGYGIIHHDSPDERGIDVALLFKKSHFIPFAHKSHSLLLYNEKNYRKYTRDQLVVMGVLDSEEIYLVINHWPSRSGGASRSKPYRIAAARLNKKIIDSIYNINPDARILTMGDFNDDPTDRSLKTILNAKNDSTSLTSNDLYNPMEHLFKKGLGSLAYRDQWSLFDQILLSGNFLKSNWRQYSYWKAKVFRPSFLITRTGRFQGYPFRSYAGGNYKGGYSDHFPVYILLIKKVL